MSLVMLQALIIDASTIFDWVLICDNGTGFHDLGEIESEDNLNLRLDNSWVK
jgi:hypothetical protein